jgi:hypothetical protein
LVYALITKGNEDNCGCFGTVLEMTPLESIIKNIVMLLLGFLLLKPEIRTLKYLNFKFVPILIFIIAFALPFILNPVHIARSQNFAENSLDYDFEYELFKEYTDIDYSQGEHIVCFMSVTCPHCVVAAQKMTIISNNFDLPPVFLYLIGSEEKVESFFKKSNSKFEYKMFPDENFFKLSGPYLPSIQYVKDGKVMAKWTNASLNENDFSILFQKK